MNYPDLKTMTEAQLRDAESPRPESIAELMAIIDALANREHDYGTCVYAMSIAAEAAFRYVASKLGVTGFQASCADLDFLKRIRHMERFRIVNMHDLLYPQYRHHFDELDFDRQIEANAEWLVPEAKKLLAEQTHASETVVAHWQRLATLSLVNEGAKQ